MRGKHFLGVSKFSGGQKNFFGDYVKAKWGVVQKNKAAKKFREIE